MESQKGSESYQAFPMNGGDGHHSYVQNSTSQVPLHLRLRLLSSLKFFIQTFDLVWQRVGADVTKNIVKETILEKLDLETLLQNSSHAFSIADLGCSVGPNTFFTVQNIIDLVNLKIESHNKDHEDLDSVEFQVFFNDHVGNDFNILFKSLPEDKQYYAAGVAGSFHGRLFPESTIHVFNSSYALHWLSKVPKEVVDKNSPAYNKGKIYYTSEDKEVAEAYSAQFQRDFESFLSSRALELVPGGIMILIIPCVTPKFLNSFEAGINIIDDILVGMANKGLISEELVDSFNVPIYMPSSEEVKELIEKNGNFKIERSESLFRLLNVVDQLDAHSGSMHFRAAFEGVFKKQFGQQEIVDDIFVQFEKKFASEFNIIHANPAYRTLGELFIIKRN
ncbi:hypothetical protein K1719_000495 [Acacia pycnantha]|nr:hypothetical protein K1719_000495 [Acacia pycnantha]